MSTKAAPRRACDCGRPAPSDAFICKVCTATLARQLRELPERIAEVEDTAYRLDRVASDGERSGGKGKVRPLPYRPEVGPLLDRARNSVTTWTRDVLESRGLRSTDRMPVVLGPPCGSNCEHPSCRAIRSAGRFIVPSSTAGMCDWLARRTDSIRLGPQAGAIATSVARLTGDLLAVTDLPPSPIYLGPCDSCQRPMYVARGERVHLCTTRACDHTYNVERRIAHLLKESRNVVATASTIATALTSLDAPVTEDRIAKWRERGRLAVIKTDPRGRPMHRVGDVLDLCNAEQRKAVERAKARLSSVSR